MSAWNKWLRQPQSVPLRRALFQIHLWAGIGLGLYIFMISVTGSLLVYRRDLLAAVTTARVSPQAHRLTQEELGAILQTTYPGFAIENISAPRVRGQTIPDLAVDVELRHDSTVIGRLVDPYTGVDMGSDHQRIVMVVLWLADLHDNLLASSAGRMVNGIAAILATLLTLTGAVLWWPGIRTWRTSLTFDWKRKRYGFNWSLHNFVGFWTLLFVLVWGISGIYLCFPKVFNITVDFFEPVAESSRQARFGDAILSWLAQLHFGRFSGFTVKAIWTVLGLAPAVLTITGGLMWWYRVVLGKWKRVAPADVLANDAPELRATGGFGEKPTAAL